MKKHLYVISTALFVTCNAPIVLAVGDGVPSRIPEATSTSTFIKGTGIPERPKAVTPKPDEPKSAGMPDTQDAVGATEIKAVAAPETKPDNPVGALEFKADAVKPDDDPETRPEDTELKPDDDPETRPRATTAADLTPAAPAPTSTLDGSEARTMLEKPAATTPRVEEAQKTLEVPYLSEREEKELRSQIRRRHQLAEVKRFMEVTAKGLAIPVVTYTAWQYRDDLSEGVKGGVAATGLPMILVAHKEILSAIQEPIWFAAEKLGMVPLSRTSSYRQLLYKFKEDFEVGKRFLSETEQMTVEDLIARFEQEVLFCKNSSGYNPRIEIERLIARLKAIFNLPRRAHPIRERSSGRAMLSEHLQTYSPELGGQILEIFDRVQRGQKKVSFYFKGEPGTGKTVTAQAIARALNLPIREINLSTCDSLLKKGLCERDDSTTLFSPGEIAQALLQPSGESGKTGTNPIIFFDEAHDALNSKGSEALYSEIKLLTDPTRQKIHDEKLGVDLDISRATLIFAGNEELTKDTRGALDTRLITIEFPPITAEQKREIALRHFRTELRDYDIAETPERLKCLDKIIEEDKNPGVRKLLQTITGYVIKQID